MAADFDTSQAARTRPPGIDPVSASDWRSLDRLLVVLAVAWSLAFVVVGAGHGLQMYGDGSFFSYAIAVGEAWTYHWHNISGRIFVYLACHVPAEAFVTLTGNAQGGIAVYGLLFFVAPLLGLAATWRLDRSGRRVIFAWACLSNAVLCPLVFGFPTEMWLSMALFWPALAACWSDVRGVARAVLVYALLQALVLTHEGAVLFAATIVAATLLLGHRDVRFRRALSAFVAAMLVWAAIRARFQPDAYLAETLARNALVFIDLSKLVTPFSSLLLAATAAFGALVLSFRLLRIERPELLAALCVALMLAVYWTRYDHALHADGRYFFRTGLTIATPLFGGLAAAYALIAENRDPAYRLFCWPISLLEWIAAHLSARSIAALLLLVSLVQAVEAVKFVSAWDAYKAGVAALAQSPAGTAGDPRFVSSAALGDRLNRLAWASTTHYLSVLVAPGFAPARLVVDPDPGYFYLACPEAEHTEHAANPVPLRTRTLVREFACLHRPR